ncbi:MAG: hypothetical protein NTX41_08955 [Verrucomicrobia bacterium]|nr:hypothetical protein [Verrucomicrobiota bacterium]
MNATAPAQPPFPSRASYLFTGVPLAFLLNSLLVVRITPALWDAQMNIVKRDLAVTPPDRTYDFIVLGVAAVALLLTAWIAYRRAVRLRSDFAALWALFSCVPILGLGIALWLGTASDDDEARQPGTSEKLAGQLVVPALLCWAMISGLTALVEMKLFPQLNQQKYLSLSLLVIVPLVTAGIAGFLSSRAGRTLSQSIGAAFLTLTAILTILGFAAMEGVICILMAAPFVGLLGIIGALLGHWLATLTTRPAYQVQSAAWLAVIICAVGESIAPPPPLEDVVSSEVIINATPAQVWKQLKDIRDLPAPTEPLFVFGVAHPLEAYVVGEGGVGAARVCRLSTGDMPERISVWKPEQELKFIVLDTPAAMREATFFGQELDGAHLHTTYTSLEGGFRLEALPDGRTRLTGTSRYLLTITPATYWNLWTRHIVGQVQLRVMNHVKAKAEQR